MIIQIKKPNETIHISKETIVDCFAFSSWSQVRGLIPFIKKTIFAERLTHTILIASNKLEPTANSNLP